MKNYSDNDLKLKILNNPDIQICVLKKAHPRSNSQVVLLPDGIRIDYGFNSFKEDRDSLYFKFSEYGIEWEFWEDPGERIWS